MGAIRSAPLLWGLIDLDMLDDEVPGVETLGVGVCFGVLQEREEMLGGLFRPAGTRNTELLA